MSLPIRTTIEDAKSFCAYLKTKPTGASITDAKTVVSSKVIDGRKMSAYKYWGFIEEDGEKFRLSNRGRKVAGDESSSIEACIEAVWSSGPYKAIVERAVHRSEQSLTALEVAAHWFEHFKSEASENDKILNDQAICFFHLAQASNLGRLVVGRKGQPTRFEFDLAKSKSFAEGTSGDQTSTVSVGADVEAAETKTNSDEADGAAIVPVDVVAAVDVASTNRVFITHGKNQKILEQVKEIVSFGKFEAVVSKDNETIAKPVPEKVMDDMRSCGAAVIHVSSEGNLMSETGEAVPQINGNVLIEIGAAMALFGRKFILLVEDGVQLPSNLQGLYECRYSGDQLDMPATMKLLKTFNEFR